MISHSLPAVRGRLAPSPTGRLHLGNAYAFLAAWLRTRSQGGTLILRLEDIDPERSRESFAEGIYEDLAWLGLTWDEGPDQEGSFGPYAQSRRLDRYSALLDDLQRRGLAYPCYCTRKELRLLASAPHIGDEGVPYPGTCRALSSGARLEYEDSSRKASLRLNIQASLAALRTGEDEDVHALMAFRDAVLGPQAVATATWGGDFALRRSDGVVAYQLAVAADDAAMGVTEVVRGDDLAPSTPRQILLLRLMGAAPPLYAHLPLLCDASGERLAKRHQGLEIAALRRNGIGPEAIIGYLGYLAGWQAKAQPAEPSDLLSGFSLATLMGRQMRLPPDPLRVIAAV
ncbi:MAG: tRNA glutamyl-Q(34) synthetase GluQRS [Desulfovibrionaceae bacterium]|nr:tRNA glutamyl-Q(34) synthetase GluQRS [Desulfovibrionaceae bacterium]